MRFFGSDDRNGLQIALEGAISFFANSAKKYVEIIHRPDTVVLRNDGEGLCLETYKEIFNGPVEFFETDDGVIVIKQKDENLNFIVRCSSLFVFSSSNSENQVDKITFLNGVALPNEVISIYSDTPLEPFNQAEIIFDSRLWLEGLDKIDSSFFHQFLSHLSEYDRIHFIYAKEFNGVREEYTYYKSKLLRKIKTI